MTDSTTARVLGPKDGKAGRLGSIGVRFMIDGRPYQFEVGQAYEINNQKTHSVMNKGDTDRINFIFDYVPPSAKQGGVAITTAQAAAAGS